MEMNNKIAVLNKYIQEQVQKGEGNSMNVIMDLALEAGFEYFNPYRATDAELNEIYEVIAEKV